MRLQTQIPLQRQSNNLIGYSSNILLLGSCFVENIGNKLEYFKFQSTVNPLGILFHPQAIETLILNAVNQRRYTKEDLFFLNEQWHCFDAHSKLSSVSKEHLIEQLNNSVEKTKKQLHTATHVVITLGTSWIYRFAKTNKVVANCHKVPQKQFSKELLSVEEVIESLENIKSLIKKVNPEATIIFTVSPVRHIKDGFVENTQSKSHLITAIHSVLNNVAYYFPSYEIMMDELRDYRFYAEDMVHPNQLAVNYIWEKFKEVWFSKDTYKIMDEVDAIQKGLHHKPFNPNSEAHKAFIQNLEEKQKQLQLQYPHISF